MKLDSVEKGHGETRENKGTQQCSNTLHVSAPRSSQPPGALAARGAQHVAGAVLAVVLPVAVRVARRSSLAPVTRFTHDRRGENASKTAF